MSRGDRFAGFLIFAVALFFCRGWLEGKVLLPLAGDNLYSFYSSFSFYYEWVRRGVWPLWNPLSVCGVPYGLGLVSQFDLYRVMMFFLPLNTAYNFVIFSTVFLNGLFFYFFVRRRGVSAAAGFAGALVWMFGMALRSTGVENESGFFFLPLSFLLTDLFYDKPSRGRFAALVGSLAFFMLNANPQYFLYGAALLFAYMLREEISRRRKFLRGVFFAMLPFFMAAGLTSFHFARLLEMAGQSNRSTWSEIQALLPVHYPLFVFPDLFKSAHFPELNFLFERTLQGVFASAGPFSRVEVFVSPPYLGLVPAAAAVTGFFALRPKERDSLRFFLWAMAAPIVYMTLHPLLYVTVIRRIPFLNGMTNVNRIYSVYVFSAAVVAALVIDRLANRSGKIGAAFRKGCTVLVCLALMLLSGFIGAGVMLKQYRPAIELKILSNLHADNSIFIADEGAFKARRVEEFFRFFNDILSPLNPHFWIPLTALAALLLVCGLRLRGRLGAKLFSAIILIWVWLDLGFCVGFSQPASPSAEIHRGSGMTAFFREDPGLYRVMMLEDSTTSFSKMFLRPARNVTYGIAMPQGYEQLYPRRYVRFYSLLTKRAKDAGYILHPTHEFEPELADFLNCKYIVTSTGNALLESRAGYRKVAQGEDFKIYLNESVMPRAFLVHESNVLIGGPDAVEAFIRAHPESLKKSVIFESFSGEVPAAPASQPKTEDRVTVNLYEPNRVEIAAAASADGYLVLSDNYFPGWRAFIDGRETPVILADYSFRAVRISPGEHRVVFVYDPHSVRAGLAVSLAALAALLIVLRSRRVLNFSHHD